MNKMSAPTNDVLQWLFTICSPESYAGVHTKTLNQITLAAAWPDLWSLAERHRVIPVMAKTINNQSDVELPEGISQKIKDHMRNNANKALQHAGELVLLTRMFNKHAIPFIAFKGIVLSQQMNVDMSYRHVGDIDLLLATSDDLWRADELIRNMGYRRSHLSEDILFNPPQHRYFLNTEKDITYFNSKKKISLELHFKLFSNLVFFPLPLAQLHHNRTYITIGNELIPSMSKEDHMLYLLIHGSACCWFRLKWLCDVPAISNNGHDYTELNILNRAKKIELDRTVAQGLSFTHELFGMPISNEVGQYCDENKIIQRLNRYCRKALGDFNNSLYYSDLPLHRLYYSVHKMFFYQFFLKAGWKYKFTVLTMYWTHHLDWKKLPLPASLFFLYYPLRPFLWILRKYSRTPR